MASRVERLERLDELRKLGALSDAEFEIQKNKLLGVASTSEPPADGASTSLETGEPESLQSVIGAPIQMNAEEAPINPTFAEQRKSMEPDARSTLKQEDNVGSPVQRFTGSVPGWRDMSDFVKFATIAAGFLVLWLTWQVLKYVGIILGIIALIYCVKRMKAAQSIASEAEGRDLKKAEIAADNFKILAGCATVLIGVSAIVDYYEFPIRQNQTQIAQADYDTQCKSGNQFDSACKGKFIIWNGAVDSVGSDYVRTKISDDLTVDIQDVNPNQQTLVEGQRVRVSGWLAKQNIIYPDISDGRVEPIESSESAMIRTKQENAALEAKSKKQHCESILLNNTRWGYVNAHCQSISKDMIEWGICVDRMRDEAKECGFNGAYQ